MLDIGPISERNLVSAGGSMTEAAPPDRMVDLERADAARRALEDAANQLEAMGGNELYRRAWRIAADFLRTIPYKSAV